MIQTQEPTDGRWRRLDKPILAAPTAGQAWCRVCLYAPAVVQVGGTYKMWFTGTASHSRSIDHSLGYAESHDGLNWTPYQGNPVATSDDIPWGTAWQTPCVRFDPEENLYRMWFVAITKYQTERADQGVEQVVDMDEALGCAVSEDGIHWDIHPEPVYPSGRGPSVTRIGRTSYAMWMCSRPSPEHPWDDLYKNIYRFTSTDGINWVRSPEPVVRPSGVIASCVYPCVVHRGDDYVMLHGGHLPNGGFELFSAASNDGVDWTCNHQAPVLPATRRPGAFDGRYTSTPCLLPEPDRTLLYYSGRSLEDKYIDGRGNQRTDTAGVYEGIGVAVLTADPNGT
jgi:hypothetical protein